MSKHGEAHLNRKFMELAKLLNIYLNHFPRHEKYALSNRIRNTAYEIYDCITEAQKRYLKKTTGNLLSQLYALIYLNPLDQYVKRVLGVKYYVRYVDDFILFGLTRSQCLEYRDRIVCYLENALRLTLSKSTIQTIRRGVNFVGYRTWRHKRFIRKFSLYKFRRALREGRIKAAASILGHAHRTNSLPYMLKLTGESTYAQNIPLPKNYR